MSRMVRIRIWFKGKYRFLQKEHESGSSEQVLYLHIALAFLVSLHFLGCSIESCSR
jgi:hypothetical protein